MSYTMQKGRVESVIVREGECLDPGSLQNARALLDCVWNYCWGIKTPSVFSQPSEQQHCRARSGHDDAGGRVFLTRLNGPVTAAPATVAWESSDVMARRWSRAGACLAFRRSVVVVAEGVSINRCRRADGSRELLCAYIMGLLSLSQVVEWMWRVFEFDYWSVFQYTHCSCSKLCIFTSNVQTFDVYLAYFNWKHNVHQWRHFWAGVRGAQDDFLFSGCNFVVI